MNVTQRPAIQIAQVHRNLESLLPLLPVFLKSQEHWITGIHAEVTV